MKGILKFEGLFMKMTSDRTMQERVEVGEFYNVRKNLYQAMYHQYQLQQLKNKKEFLQNKLN